MNFSVEPRTRLPDAALLALGAGLLALYALAGWWPLGFVALVPWLWLLDRHASLKAALLLGVLFSLAYTLAVFAWFGVAIGRYTQWGSAAGVGLLLLGAPLFQPQWLAFALARAAAGRRFGRAVGALAGACAWLGTEWLAPKLLGDTLGHGLYPAEALRQGAALGGAALLTAVLLGANELLAAWRWRAAAGALLPPLLLAGFGWHALQAPPPAGATVLRVGLVQANLTDIEARREAIGSGAALRELLDLHLAMSWDAVERQQVDAVLWSETVYPTPLGHPKSAAGAAFDAELLATLAASGRPFVLGTYDGSEPGREYNAAAFIDPQQGLQGFYRKTRLFPFTEYLPPWLEGLRPWLPGVGAWAPGNGPRPMLLRVPGGREVAVQALICRDDVDPTLALQAARLGAQALLTMSNDAWFSDAPVGARLHHAVAAFRSIETGLPQFRVTSNGFSAVIDPQGRVVASAGQHERALVVGSLPVGGGAPTLMLRWGDWVGALALGLLLLVALAAMPWRRWLAEDRPQAALPQHLVLLPTPVRALAALLRLASRGVLLGLGLALLLDDALRTQQWLLTWVFLAGVLWPELLAACLLQAFRVAVDWDEAGQRLRLRRGAQTLQLARADMHSLSAWRLPWPAPGASLRMADGPTHPLCGVAPARLHAALGFPLPPARPYQQAREAVVPGRWHAPWLKFGLLPLLLALPAFHLHQHIAYGSLFGEWQTFGPRAWWLALGLWWAAWALGVALCAAALRLLVELGSGLAAWLRPAQALGVRLGLERAALLGLYLGLPLWLALRLAG